MNVTMEGTRDDISLDHKKQERRRNRFELRNTFILAIATLSVTWCTYQGNLWNGVQTFRLASSSYNNRLAQEKRLAVNQHMAMDEGVILNFVRDVVEGNDKHQDFYLERLRPELRDVLQGWLDTDPLHNPKAPPHPMATEEYKKLIKRESAEADALLKIADKNWDEAQIANSYADRYSLFTVVFSMVMFLSAITTKMSNVRLSYLVIAVAGLICVVILFMLFLSMPIASLHK